MRNKPRNMKDLIGTKIGFLTIIKKSDPRIWILKNGKTSKSTVWNCLCSCGNTCKVGHSNLFYGNTQSCGCQKVNLFLKSYQKNYGDIYHPNPVEMQLYDDYKSNNKKGRNFNLSFNLFCELVKSPCYYCGLEPFQIRWNSRKSKYKKLGGIDRLDSSIGYQPENVVPSCVHCNRAKMNRTQEEFKTWIKLIYNNIYK